MKLAIFKLAAIVLTGTTISVFGGAALGQSEPDAPVAAIDVCLEESIRS